jgi:hypothetical protein
MVRLWKPMCRIFAIGRGRHRAASGRAMAVSRSRAKNGRPFVRIKPRRSASLPKRPAAPGGPRSRAAAFQATRLAWTKATAQERRPPKSPHREGRAPARLLFVHDTAIRTKAAARERRPPKSPHREGRAPARLLFVQDTAFQTKAAAQERHPPRSALPGRAALPRGCFSSITPQSG